MHDSREWMREAKSMNEMSGSGDRETLAQSQSLINGPYCRDGSGARGSKMGVKKKSLKKRWPYALRGGQGNGCWWNSVDWEKGCSAVNRTTVCLAPDRKISQKKERHIQIRTMRLRCVRLFTR